jgi:hypothetical protein
VEEVVRMKKYLMISDCTEKEGTWIDDVGRGKVQRMRIKQE